MSEYKIDISRPLVGALALICLTAWIGIWLTWPNDEDWKLWQAGFMRVGLVMSAFWLALPGKNRPAAWTSVSPKTLIGLLLAIVGIVLRPRLMIPLLLVLAVVGYFLRPRERGPRMKSRPRRRRAPRETTSSDEATAQNAGQQGPSQPQDAERNRLPAPASSSGPPPTED